MCRHRQRDTHTHTVTHRHTLMFCGKVTDTIRADIDTCGQQDCIFDFGIGFLSAGLPRHAVELAMLPTAVAISLSLAAAPSLSLSLSVCLD